MFSPDDMRIFVLLILSLWAFFPVQAQTAAELNQQSKLRLGEGNYAEALPLVQKAAEMGSPEAQYNYGVFFQQGVGIEPNDSLALYWFLRAAEQGWADAQFKVSYNYAAGQGVPQDFAKAFEWTKRCADQQHAECMMNLITFYQQGVGTEKNMKEVLQWATRLATLKENNSESEGTMIGSARYSLALMYLKGEGVEADTAKSYQWFLLTNENKINFPLSQQQQIIGEIKICESVLNKRQRKRAQKKAARLIGRPLSKLHLLYKEEEIDN